MKMETPNTYLGQKHNLQATQRTLNFKLYSFLMNSLRTIAKCSSGSFLGNQMCDIYRMGQKLVSRGEYGK